MSDFANNDPTLFQGLFWQAFGASAQLLIDPECVRHAKSVGFYMHVANNSKLFDKDSELLEETMCCCCRAGYRAGELARQDGEATVSVEHFAKACDEIMRKVNLVRQRQQSRGRIVRGGACA